MSNLHAPTVPSGPTTAPATNGRAGHLSIAELQRKKDNLEAELKALGGVLESHNVDMSTSLLTPDGFPRADLDVAQIRTTRARIIHLRNDYKDLMTVIEKQLHEHFASLDDDEVGSSSATAFAMAEPLPDSAPEALDPPFAKVNSVVDGSPANSAGLKQNVLVKITRTSGPSQAQELRLTLTPRRDWGGRVADAGVLNSGYSPKYRRMRVVDPCGARITVKRIDTVGLHQDDRPAYESARASGMADKIGRVPRKVRRLYGGYDGFIHPSQ
ncbi:hypothetical protein RB595_008471 [Gaeumannomyces hyphopodioides]